MMKQQLGRYIFSDNTFVYAILDGAAIPDLLMRFYEMRPPHVCLYRGELDADLAEVAPYLVNLQPTARFTDWVLSECWGKHWGIFLHTPYLIHEARRHFRKFLTVHNEDGNPMIFRYYDPRVISKFLPTCQPDELDLIFEKATAFFAESDDAAELVRLRYDHGKLERTNFKISENFEVPGQASYAPPVRHAEFSYA